MGGTPGWRETKKQRTRHALIQHAVRLFTEQGYEATTIAEISTAAEISPRTFFSYFRTKEDVLFFDHETRMARALAILAEPRPDEAPARLLRRALLDSVLAESADNQLAAELATTRTALVNAEPALQARELHLLFATQRELAHALHGAYPGLDLVDAAAAVGAMVGAVTIAAATARAAGDDEDAVRAAARHAVDLVLDGLDTLGRPARGRRR
ncbi:TetR/AcrR family transcriptional regulator [Actinocatenispora rupis]|nr:TetR/AcrR family transcriptional regulator [Actinocatenispora rupis]